MAILTKGLNYYIKGTFFVADGKNRLVLVKIFGLII